MPYTTRFYSHAHVCEDCGEVFHASRYDAKYCSSTCRGRARRKLQRAAKLRDKLNTAIIDYLNLYEDVQQYENAISDLVGMVTRHSLLDRDNKDGVQ